MRIHTGLGIRLAATAALATLAAATAGCVSSDSTDISGAYFGNVIETVVAGSAGGVGSSGAGSATITVANVDDDVRVTLASGCALDAARDQQETVAVSGAGTRFVFTSDSVLEAQTCALPGLGGGSGISFTVAEGDLVTEHGGTTTLEVGGPTADGGYAVYQFAGALP